MLRVPSVLGMRRRAGNVFGVIYTIWRVDGNTKVDVVLNAEGHLADDLAENHDHYIHGAPKRT